MKINSSMPDEIRLQRMLGNGSWVDCADRSDEFLKHCIENKQRINGEWATIDKQQAIDALKAGVELRYSPDGWNSTCRCGNAHDRKLKNRPSQQHKIEVKKQGQIWEPCKCGAEPVYMPLMLCDRCWPTK